MKKLALIVDDEPLGLERVRMFLETEDDFQIGAVCDGGSKAVEQIVALRPDVVFLDIQMPDLDGFGVLVELKRLNAAIPVIVFVTAFDKHAVQAFEINAVDYLLKPGQRERFKTALNRVRDRLKNPNPEAWEAKPTKILQQVRPENLEQDYLQRMEIRSQSRTDFINIADVYRLLSLESSLRISM